MTWLEESNKPVSTVTKKKPRGRKRPRKLLVSHRQKCYEKNQKRTNNIDRNRNKNKDRNFVSSDNESHRNSTAVKNGKELSSTDNSNPKERDMRLEREVCVPSTVAPAPRRHDISLLGAAPKEQPNQAALHRDDTPLLKLEPKEQPNETAPRRDDVPPLKAEPKEEPIEAAIRGNNSPPVKSEPKGESNNGTSRRFDAPPLESESKEELIEAATRGNVSPPVKSEPKAEPNETAPCSDNGTSVKSEPKEGPNEAIPQEKEGLPPSRFSVDESPSLKEKMEGSRIIERGDSMVDTMAVPNKNELFLEAVQRAREEMARSHMVWDQEDGTMIFL